MCFSRIRQESDVLQIERGIRVWIRVSTYLRHSGSTLPYSEYREFWSVRNRYRYKIEEKKKKKIGRYYEILCS